MGTQLSDTDTGLPTELPVADRPGLCPECKHESGAYPEPQSRLAAFFSLHPRRPGCRVELGDVTGWGSDGDCGCKNAFHLA